MLDWGYSVLTERQRRQRIIELLVELEQQLRVLGWWSDNAPTAAQLSSELPFCIDTLVFEQWLQFIYIPRLTEILANSRPLPRQSGVAAMAEEVLDQSSIAVDQLIDCLRQLDELFG